MIQRLAILLVLFATIVAESKQCLVSEQYKLLKAAKRIEQQLKLQAQDPNLPLEVEYTHEKVPVMPIWRLDKKP